MTPSTLQPPIALARPSLATPQVRDQAMAWLDTGIQRLDTAAEEPLLHAFETAAITRPPASSRAGLLDADLVRLYLRLCHRWIAATTASADPRFLNAALKIIPVCAVPTRSASALSTEVGNAALAAVDTLAADTPSLPAKALTPPVPAPLAPPPPTSGLTPHSDVARIAVLAGAHSRGLDLFMTAARAHHVPIIGVLGHEPDPSPPAPDSYYTHAWYPRQAPPAVTHTPAARDYPRVSVAHRDWDAVAEQLSVWRTELLVLLGMDVVPPTVLAVPQVATLNAHNGALPAFRGMDTVAWAILAGGRPTCTVHLVTANVDAGDVLCHQAVPTDTGNLRHVVKETQVSLLVSLCATLATTGSLPPSRTQTGTPRRFYRMHPTIRRIADTRFAQLQPSPEGSRP